MGPHRIENNDAIERNNFQLLYGDVKLRRVNHWNI